MNTNFLSANYWNERYLQNQTGWDIGHVSTPLKEYFDQLTDKNIRILIPGGGNSYEAVYLLEKGFTNITVVDISEVVTDQLTTKYTNPHLHIITSDFFALQGQYDLIIEQTFFCALDPSLRVKYVQTVKELLTDNGKLAGLLFNREFDTNPPFGGNAEEYRQLFSSAIRILVLEACYNSIPARAGSELFLIACKQGDSAV
jgi:SAM-dependent methyltransferase